MYTRHARRVHASLVIVITTVKTGPSLWDWVLTLEIYLHVSRSLKRRGEMKNRPITGGWSLEPLKFIALQCRAIAMQAEADLGDSLFLQ